METFIVILVVGLVIYLIVKGVNKSTKSDGKSSGKIDIPFEITLSNSNPNQSVSSVSQNGKFKPIKQDANGFWILNPEAPFELTLLNTDKNLAQAIRELLDMVETNFYQSTINAELLVLFLENDIKIKEVEEYKEKYQPQYKNKIEELKLKSKEWSLAYEKDREDLLEGFREIAVKEIYERLNDDFNYETLFEWEPKNAKLDIELIKEFGFQNIDFYLRYYNDKTEKIHVIPNDKKQRPIFENLVKLGLATNGFNLPKEEILNILSLKELNDIASNSDKEYKRKNQAIEYLLTTANIEEKIGNKIALRELFKLKPLPDKYSLLNIDDILKKWDYYYEVIGLLRQTYYNSKDAYIKLNDNKDSGLYKISYEIELPYDNYPCQCAKDRKKRKFSKSDVPKIPCHIGCQCQLIVDYD